jgi:hypothetical protein
MSNKIAAFKALEDSGFTRQNAEIFLNSIENDETHLATKGDINSLKLEIHSIKNEMEMKLHKELNSQTWKFLGGLITLGTIFKAMDIIIQHWR